MIAATAIVYGLTIVTRNVTDFTLYNVSLLNLFEATRERKSSRGIVIRAQRTRATHSTLPHS
jgi:hypothetical protein